FHVTGVQTCALPISDFVLPPMTDVRISQQGIEYPASRFLTPQLGPVVVDGLDLMLRRFAFPDQRFPWFEWDRRDTGPWDFEFTRSEERRVGQESGCG